MRHGSSCGCPDCMNANPEKFRNVGIAMPKPLKKAVEIAAGLLLREGKQQEAGAVIISDAVRPLRDAASAVRLYLGFTSRSVKELLALDAALREWEDME